MGPIVNEKKWKIPFFWDFLVKISGASKNDYIILNGTLRFMILCIFLGEMVSHHFVSCRNDFYHIVSWIFVEKKHWIRKLLFFFPKKLSEMLTATC